MDTWDHMHSDVGAYVLSIISMNDESVDSSADKLHSLYSRRARHLAHMQVVSQVPGFQPRTSAPLSTPSHRSARLIRLHSRPQLATPNIISLWLGLVYFRQKLKFFQNSLLHRILNIDKNKN